MSREQADYARFFHDLETQRLALIAEISAWPVARQCFRASPGTWCAVEVLDHIVRAESGTVADVRDGLRHPHPLGTEERPRIAALDRALRSDGTFQVPATAAAIHPDPSTTLPDVVARWEQSRAELAALLQTLSPAETQCGVFHHPFAGWMTVGDVLDHFAAHLFHHEFQLARLRTASA